ncbi:MAG: type II secretion system F family protein [Betaproteobacteria bacterium]
MAYFNFRGRNARGELVTGTLEGADAGVIADQLMNTGVTPVDISTSRRISGAEVPAWWRRFNRHKVSLLDLMLFSRQMYTLLKAGVPILKALAGLQESAVNPTMIEVIKDLRVSLDSGRELSTSMRQHPDVFSYFYVSLVKVGELTGQLENVFLRLYHHLEFEKEIREAIRAAVRYPIFVLCAMAGAIVIINLFVIPAFAKVYSGFKAELPFLTKMLIGFSNFMVESWFLQLAALIGAAFAFRAWTATRAGKYTWDRYKLKVPIAGKILLKATLARFARSFALALQSGVPVVQALSTVALVVDNDYIGQRIEQMRDGVERGESVLRAAVAAGIFTTVVLQMIAVGDETGELDSLLREVADLYENDVEYEVKTLSQQIEPILIIGLGGLVLVLALGVFLPIWDLGKAAIAK